MWSDYNFSGGSDQGSDSDPLFHIKGRFIKGPDPGQLHPDPKPYIKHNDFCTAFSCSKYGDENNKYVFAKKTFTTSIYIYMYMSIIYIYKD